MIVIVTAQIIHTVISGSVVDQMCDLVNLVNLVISVLSARMFRWSAPELNRVSAATANPSRLILSFPSAVPSCTPDPDNLPATDGETGNWNTPLVSTAMKKERI